MKVIQPNCRVQFTAADVDFIAANLSRKTGDAECVTRLLSDPESRDAILDDESLFRAVLENRGCLTISSHLYFYILVRHVLRRSGIEDRVVADYVAEILSEYSNIERTKYRAPGQPEPLNYFFEMMMALQRADDRNNFELRAHIGNYALFITGVFPDRIRVRAEKRGFPDLRYFEGLGQASFLAASDHRLAQRYDLAAVLGTLGERFRTARQALNDLSERLLAWEDDRYALPLLTSAKLIP